MNGMAPGFPARIVSPQVESVEIPQRQFPETADEVKPKDIQ